MPKTLFLLAQNSKKMVRPFFWKGLHVSLPKAANLAALHLLHQAMQLCTEASSLGFVPMHDGVFKQRT